MILGPVNANRNPFIYLNNMGKVMTSGRAVARHALALAAALAFPIGSAARAETGAWAESAHAKARLIAATSGTGEATSVRLGLEIKLEPGWKTYWRSPGEGGMPPRFDWSGSANVGHLDTAWPAPKRFEIGGLESVGYANHVILPLDVALAKPGEPLAARLSLQYAVCREICMLVEARLALDLPAGAGAETAQALSNAEAIARFQSRVPRAGAEHGWRVVELGGQRLGGAGPEGRDVIVIDVAATDVVFAKPELLIEGQGLRFGKAIVKPGRGRHVRFVAPVQSRGAAAHGGTELVLTLIDGERAGAFTVRFEPPAR